MLQLTRPTVGLGQVRREELTELGTAELRTLRRDMQVVFQDPFASLDPRMPVAGHRRAAADPRTARPVSDQQAGWARCSSWWASSPTTPTATPTSSPAASASASASPGPWPSSPKLLVLDEPVSALDVSIQAGVVNLLEDLQDRLGVAYLFIAHDLSVVRHISDRVAVMYLGKIVEIGDRADIYERPGPPLHPGAPLGRARARPARRAGPPAHRAGRRRAEPAAPPSGCRFRTRCWKAQDICATEEPALVDRGQGHPVACHFAEVTAVV